MDKLLWFNKHYLDSKSKEQLTNAINNKNFDGGEYSNNVLLAIRDRCSTLNDFVVHSSYFFKDPEEFEDTLINKHCKEGTHAYLSLLRSYLSELEKWDQISIKEVIDKSVSELDIGFGKIGLPLRLALTATVNSPSIDLVCEILGKDIVLKRLDNFLSMIQSLEKDL
tara:strand:- start:216 stop:716 length:501 start_codon:yes stop_codon:yes gene_type:complete